MNRKLARLIEPNIRPVIACLILFVALAIPFSPTLAVVEAALTVVLYAVLQRSSVKRKKNLMQYIDTMTGTMDSASRANLLDAPVPMMVFRVDGLEIVWSNDRFLAACGREDGLYDVRVTELLPDFSCKWVTDGATESPERVQMGDRVYRVFGSVNRLAGKSVGENLLATTYWVDVTESDAIVSAYQATRPVVSVLVIDNYEELMKAGGEAAKSAVLAQIDERLNDWVSGKNGLLRKYDRDHYLFVCEEQYFEQMVEEKFSILDTVHEVTSEDGVTATLSIGMAKDGGFEELFDTANKCIEMALSRGGDQAVVKDRLNFTFFGGRTREAEHRSKVRSRVTANSLMELIGQSSRVFIMGHKNADMDAVGAAVGVSCMCRKKGKPFHIVLDLERNVAKNLVAEIRQVPEYKNAFISSQEALLLCDPRSTLIVVDTNRPDQVESQSLLETVTRVCVIDHHRRAADYITPVVVNFHEPYASSASELVTELLQYAVEKKDVLPIEAKGLMTGIFLDTKSFNVRTGERTFEAAAFLRQLGADTVEVKKLLQNDFQDTIAKYQVIKSARLYRKEIAIAALKDTIARPLAAQAADELLNISGITASFVLFPDGDQVILSARSIGDVNVQVIVEPLGGGGNTATAGAQLKNTTVKDALDRLVASIDQYFEN